MYQIKHAWNKRVFSFANTLPTHHYWCSWYSTLVYRVYIRYSLKATLHALSRRSLATHTYSRVTCVYRVCEISFASEADYNDAYTYLYVA